MPAQQTGIIERKGLSKVKHVDLDHLWLQQEQARRLLPLQKVDGAINPADLMTKHLPEAVIKKHVRLLRLELAQGRAGNAAQLHALSTQGRKGRTGDTWDAVCKAGHWRRRHVTWRRCLFTPFRVPGCPENGARLDKRRMTIGFKRNGEKFIVEDSWKEPSNSHRMMPFEWTGATVLYNEVEGLNELRAGQDDHQQTRRPHDIATPHLSPVELTDSNPRGCLGRDTSPKSCCPVSVGDVRGKDDCSETLKSFSQNIQLPCAAKSEGRIGNMVKRRVGYGRSCN